MTPRILIIAYGNPLRSDDSFAWHAVDLLRGKLSTDDLDILCVHQLTPDLAQRISLAKGVIYLDARADGNPGQISCVSVTSQADNVAWSHVVGPSQLMALSRFLFGTSPEGYEVSVTGESFAYGEELSATIQNVMPQALETMDHLIKKMLRKRNCEGVSDHKPRRSGLLSQIHSSAKTDV